jgi:hypothetical protein
MEKKSREEVEVLEIEVVEEIEVSEMAPANSRCQ